MTAVTDSELEASYATRAVDTEAPTPPLGFCSCRSGQALASTSTIIRACPRHTYVRDVSCRLLKRSERKLAPMTVSSPNVIEIKLDRKIADERMR